MTRSRYRFGIIALLTAVSSFARAADPVFAEGDPSPISLPEGAYTVKIKPELAGTHPRIFFNKAGLEVIREKMKDPRMAAMRTQFLAGADALLEKTPPGHPPQTDDPFRDFGNRLSITAMAYLLTGDAKYLDSTKEWMTALCGYPAWSNDDDLGCAHCLMGMAMAYDWLHDQLTPQERQQAEAAMLLHARHMMIRSEPSQPGTNWGWAYFQNHEWVDYNGVTFAAMALYDLQTDEMQSWLDYTRTKFQPAYTDLGVDGGNYEGPAYEHYGTQQLLMYVDALHVFSGESLYEMPYLKRIGYFSLYSMMPDWKNVANFGDSGETGRGSVDDENPLEMAALQHDGHFLTYLQSVRRVVGGKEPLTALAVIWIDPSIEPKPLDDLPLIGLYPDLGFVICRTSWDADAAVVAFHCGAPGGTHLMENWASFKGANPAFSHAHPDANSFLFWADHDWRISAPGGYTHAKVTHDENVWTVGGKGQMGEAKWFDAHGYLNKNNQPHLVIVTSNPKADYLVGEAAPAYQADCKLTSFRRHILLVKGARPYLVVYDYLKASSPQTWTSYLHANGAFAAGDDNSSFLVTAPATFGSFLAPGKLNLQAQPLTVVNHPDDKTIQRGFELTARPDGSSDSTWLVSVIGIDEQKAILLGSRPAPSIQVGGDKISWDAQDGVTLNGEPVTGNLLPVTHAPSGASRF